MRAAIVAAAIGGTLAIVEGLLLVVLGSLAGLAENPEDEAAMTAGYLVLALGAIVIASIFVSRRWPFVLVATTAAAAAAGFLVENALWIFAAAFLAAAAAFGVISKRADPRLARRHAKPS